MIEALRQQAEKYKSMYKLNLCTREEAKNNIQPYLDELNKKSKELAKKYNQKPKKINFSSYVR